MSSSSPLFAAEQRASRYWFNDGLPTLLTGGAYLLMAFFLLYPRGENTSPFAAIVSFVAIAGYAVLLLRQRQILDWLKSRITYPRTGYVTPPRCADPQSCVDDSLSLAGTEPSSSEAARQLTADRTKHMWLMICLTTAAMLPVLFLRNPWICSVAGLLMSAAMWLAARREQQLTWFALAGFPIVGIALALFLPRSITGPERMAWFLAGSGAIFFLDGALILFRYLRANPRPTAPNR